MPTCPRCQSPLKADALRCPQCGAWRNATSPEADPPADLDTQLVALLAAGRKIAAIKLLREQTNSSLVDAKNAVEALAAKHGIPSPTGNPRALIALAMLVAIGVALAFFVEAR